MMIFYGTDFYGKVDRVPGLLYVITRFSNVWYLPFVPIETYVIFDRPGDKGRRGVRIPMRWKSVFLGWLRGACALGLIISATVAFIGVLNTSTNEIDERLVLVGLGWFLVAAALLTMSYVPTKANLERAIVLGRFLGISEEVVRQHLTPQSDRLDILERQAQTELDLRLESSDEDRNNPPDTSIRRG
jgi:hypothetical protein